jgi:hypothetical protein
MGRGAELALGANQLNQLASSFYPGITWTGSVEARGFKDTHMKTVLHYCLAVAFGQCHQARIGNTLFKVDLFPIENRASVHFSSTSVLALDGLNIGIDNLGAINNFILEKGARILAPSNLSRGIGEFQKDLQQAGQDAAKQWWNGAMNISRRWGPAGIWDMGQSSIKCGIPPISMMLGEEIPQPFGDIFRWSWVEQRPMLTKDLALNPEPPPFLGMDFTHYDLRSLVAQCMYDPGVMPPVPDTNLALISRELP